MKRSTIILSLIFFIIGMNRKSLAQINLPEVNVIATNYKYLSSIDNKVMPIQVKRLELEAAIFDVKNSKYYEDDYDNYFISFFIPEGSILAAYDKDGRLIRTAEKFKNVAIPVTITQSVYKKYPQWKIAEDVYLVNYQDNKGTTKIYKLMLEKGSKRMKIKIDEKGDFI